MPVCEVCTQVYHGNCKQCPVCASEKSAKLEKELVEKEGKIEELNRSLIESPRCDPNTTALVEVTKSLQQTVAGLQDFMKEILRESREDRRGSPPAGEKQPAVEKPVTTVKTPVEVEGAAFSPMDEIRAAMQELTLELRRSRESPKRHLEEPSHRHLEGGGKHGGHDTKEKRRLWGERQRRSTFDDLWEGRDDSLADLLRGVEKKRSKFDILQYLPESERKKTNAIDSAEKLIVCLSKLIDDLSDMGEPTKGLRAHMVYIATKSAENIYDIKALVAYDVAIRDKADKSVIREGEDPFVGVDTSLSNFHLGYSGTKHARSLSTQNQIGQSSKGRGNFGKNRQGQGQGRQSSTFAGWKKLAAERGCCFSYCVGRHCEGCAYKHQCTYCNATDHGMLKCTQHDPGASHSG